METSVENTETKEQTWGPYQLRPNPRAILRLSLGTAGGISTVLVLPDIINLMPTSPNLYILVCKVVGMWGFCCVYWTVGFLCILHLVRIFGSSIRLDAEGIKLGRIGKKIPWDSVDAVTISERPIFSKVFFTPAYMMNIHLRKTEAGLSLKRLTEGTKQIASFLYTPEEFYSLFFHICRFGTGAEPRSLNTFAFKDIQNPSLRKISEEGRLKRIGLTGLIAFGLVAFLGRKAIVYSNFNQGNKEFYEGHYEKAAACYKKSASAEFTFGPAWDRLARCEFRLGDSESAEKHWREALKWKPDLVESKLGLSKIYIMKGKLEEAEKLIQSSNRLASTDEAAYINRALIESLMGKNKQAIEKLELYVKQRVGRELATGILARCYLRAGEVDKADAILKTSPALLNNPYTKPFCTAVLAEVKIARGENDAALEMLRPYLKSSDSDPELTIDLAHIYIAKKDFDSARKQLDKLIKVNPDDPWAAIAMADLELSSGGSSADFWLERALNFKYKDSCLLGQAARIFEKYGKSEKARELAQQAIALDAANADALHVLHGDQK